MWVAEIVFVEINRCSLSPCFTSHSPRSCKCGCHCRYWAKYLPLYARQRICPASPQSMTRCATLILIPRCSSCHYIGDLIHWAAVHSHPQLDMRMLLQCSADLERTSHRLFRDCGRKGAPSRLRSTPGSVYFLFRRSENIRLFRTIWLSSCRNSICSLTSSFE